MGQLETVWWARAKFTGPLAITLSKLQARHLESSPALAGAHRSLAAHAHAAHDDRTRWRERKLRTSLCAFVRDDLSRSRKKKVLPDLGSKVRVI